MRALGCIRAAALTVVFAGACALQAPPIQLVMPAQPAPRPAANDLTVALLPFVDGRTELPSQDGRYVYGDREYEGTALRGDATSQLTQAFAERLLAAGVFREILLVRDRSQARGADLFVSGRVLRARGYVEVNPDEVEVPAEAEDGELQTRPEPWILAEVDVQDLRVVDAKGELRFDGATGWALHEEAVGVTDPWVVLGQAWARAADEVAVVWRDTDWAAQVMPESVALAPGASGFDALAGRAPLGWRAHRDVVPAPRGWEGAPGCERLVLSQAQGLRFHRALGPYVPQVRVWRCSADAVLEWDEGESYPAKLVGSGPEGRWLFLSAVGASNWSEVEAQLVEALDPTPPPQRYIFRLPPGPAVRFDVPPLRTPVEPSTHVPVQRPPPSAERQ